MPILWQKNIFLSLFVSSLSSQHFFLVWMWIFFLLMFTLVHHISRDQASLSTTNWFHYEFLFFRCGEHNLWLFDSVFFYYLQLSSSFHALRLSTTFLFLSSSLLFRLLFTTLLVLFIIIIVVVVFFSQILFRFENVFIYIGWLSKRMNEKRREKNERRRLMV